MRFSIVASVLSALTLINAQAAIPDVSTLPAACAQDCAEIIEVVSLCSDQYTNATDVAACFCNDVPSNSSISTCSTCLNSNSAASLATALSAAGSTCSQALELCAFECEITQCASSDIACQCSESYLQEVYNCAACNTANGNTDATTITNYNELRDSCVNQNFTQTPTGTEALPSPTGQDQYVAPSLTNTAGVSVATTGASSGIVVSAGGSSTGVVSVTSRTSPIASSVTGSRSATGAAGASTGASTTRATTTAASAATSSGAASSLTTGNVLAGVLAAVVGFAGFA